MNDASEISDSILSSIKKLIGIQEDEESFDVDIILNINSAISILYQLGVIKRSFTVTSKDDTYDELIPGGSEDIINQVKMYLFYKTKLVFDTSTTSSSLIEVLKDNIKETEWRLMTSFNPSNTYE